MGHVTLSIDEYLELLDGSKSTRAHSLLLPGTKTRSTPKKASKKMPKNGYHAKYGRAFKRLAPKYKKKNGSWKKDGFKRCGTAARKVAKK
jgi:hypothetical protein